MNCGYRVCKHNCSSHNGSRAHAANKRAWRWSRERFAKETFFSRRWRFPETGILISCHLGPNHCFSAGTWDSGDSGKTGIGGVLERDTCDQFWFWAPREIEEPKLEEMRAVGNDHFCDTTKRASQRLTPHTKGEVPLYHRRGEKLLIPQPWKR